MAQDLLTNVTTQPTPAKPQARAAKPVVLEQAPKMAADKLAVRKPQPKVEAKAETKKDEPKKLPSPSAAVLGPIVTAKQVLGTLANATFKSRVATTAAQGVVKAADKLGKFLPFLKSPAVAKGMTLIGRGLPFISAGILAFDAFATVKTFMNPEASGTRKALTAGRFLFNAIATGVSFIPGAGFIYSLAPALVGNGFELAMAKLNAKEAAKA